MQLAVLITLTVLHNGVSHWNIAMTTVLLEVHANVNAIDDGCRAPLHSAVYTNNMDVIELLR